MTPKVLEELVFALLEEMGSVAVEWRSSYDSINASDGGRDIEAAFARPTPDGDMDRETWWIECKERNRPVSPSVVKESVLNSTAYQDVAVFIIATNSSFSNATIDWIKEHNNKRAGPIVKLWDRRRLQSLVARYPSAAARTLVAALSLAERCDYLASYFFDSSRVLTEPELREAWAQQDEIEDYSFLVAACYADVSSNNIMRRPWLSGAQSEHVLTGTLTIALTALVAKVLREEPISNDVVVQTCAYVIGAACAKLPEHVVAAVLDNPHMFLEGSTVGPSDAIQEHLINPCKSALLRHLEERCSDDCPRHSATYDHFDTNRVFWSHFVEPPSIDELRLIVIDHSYPCAVGFEVSNDVDCPLESVDHSPTNADYVQLVKAVIEFRSTNPDGQYLKIKKSTPLSQRVAQKTGRLPTWPARRPGNDGDAGQEPDTLPPAGATNPPGS